jgi:hypothetical protein
MEVINNIEWFICSEPKTAVNKNTRKKITKKELDTIVFDTSTTENVKFTLLLNDEYSFFETRELPRPITVKQILTFIYKFYKEPLKSENMDEAFVEREDWKEAILELYDGDISKIINYDVFDRDMCTPDFCGLELNEETGEYIVHIGPE